MVNELQNKKKVDGSKVKGTSAFDIQQAKKLKEISWSNNKFESTYSGSDEK